jgi:hypothetical protein
LLDSVALVVESLRVSAATVPDGKDQCVLISDLVDAGVLRHAIADVTTKRELLLSEAQMAQFETKRKMKKGEKVTTRTGELTIPTRRTERFWSTGAHLRWWVNHLSETKKRKFRDAIQLLFSTSRRKDSLAFTHADSKDINESKFAIFYVYTRYWNKPMSAESPDHEKYRHYFYGKPGLTMRQVVWLFIHWVSLRLELLESSGVLSKGQENPIASWIKLGKPHAPPLIKEVPIAGDKKSDDGKATSSSSSSSKAAAVTTTAKTKKKSQTKVVADDEKEEKEEKDEKEEEEEDGEESATTTSTTQSSSGCLLWKSNTKDNDAPYINATAEEIKWDDTNRHEVLEFLLNIFQSTEHRELNSSLRRWISRYRDTLDTAEIRDAIESTTSELSTQSTASASSSSSTGYGSPMFRQNLFNAKLAFLKLRLLELKDGHRRMPRFNTSPRRNILERLEIKTDETHPAKEDKVAARLSMFEKFFLQQKDMLADVRKGEAKDTHPFDKVCPMHTKYPIPMEVLRYWAHEGDHMDAFHYTSRYLKDSESYNEYLWKNFVSMRGEHIHNAFGKYALVFFLMIYLVEKLKDDWLTAVTASTVDDEQKEQLHLNYKLIDQETSDATRRFLDTEYGIHFTEMSKSSSWKFFTKYSPDGRGVSAPKKPSDLLIMMGITILDPFEPNEVDEDDANENTIEHVTKIDLSDEKSDYHYRYLTGMPPLPHESEPGETPVTWCTSTDLSVVFYKKHGFDKNDHILPFALHEITPASMTLMMQPSYIITGFMKTMRVDRAEKLTEFAKLFVDQPIYAMVTACGALITGIPGSWFFNFMVTRAIATPLVLFNTGSSTPSDRIEKLISHLLAPVPASISSSKSRFFGVDTISFIRTYYNMVRWCFPTFDDPIGQLRKLDQRISQLEVRLKRAEKEIGTKRANGLNDVIERIVSRESADVRASLHGEDGVDTEHRKTETDLRRAKEERLRIVNGRTDEQLEEGEKLKYIDRLSTQFRYPPLDVRVLNLPHVAELLLPHAIAIHNTLYPWRLDETKLQKRIKKNDLQFVTGAITEHTKEVAMRLSPHVKATAEEISVKLLSLILKGEDDDVKALISSLDMDSHEARGIYYQFLMTDYLLKQVTTQRHKRGETRVRLVTGQGRHMVDSYSAKSAYEQEQKLWSNMYLPALKNTANIRLLRIASLWNDAIISGKEFGISKDDPEEEEAEEDSEADNDEEEDVVVDDEEEERKDEKETEKKEKHFKKMSKYIDTGDGSDFDEDEAESKEEKKKEKKKKQKQPKPIASDDGDEIETSKRRTSRRLRRISEKEERKKKKEKEHVVVEEEEKDEVENKHEDNINSVPLNGTEKEEEEEEKQHEPEPDPEPEPSRVAVEEEEEAAEAVVTEEETEPQPLPATTADDDQPSEAAAIPSEIEDLF